MKADGLRMTTSEHDEAFAEQEQQSDESEPPRHVDYNADNLHPFGSHACSSTPALRTESETTRPS